MKSWVGMNIPINGGHIGTVGRDSRGSLVYLAPPTPRPCIAQWLLLLTPSRLAPRPPPCALFFPSVPHTPRSRQEGTEKGSCIISPALSKTLLYPHSISLLFTSYLLVQNVTQSPVQVIIVTDQWSSLCGMDENTEGCYVFIYKPLFRKTLSNLALNIKHKQNSYNN